MREEKKENYGNFFVYNYLAEEVADDAKEKGRQ